MKCKKCGKELMQWVRLNKKGIKIAYKVCTKCEYIINMKNEGINEVDRFEVWKSAFSKNVKRVQAETLKEVEKKFHILYYDEVRIHKIDCLSFKKRLEKS